MAQGSGAPAQPWPFLLLALLFLPLRGSFPQEDGPRYILCATAARPAEARLGERRLSVYAASIAGAPDVGQRGRQAVPLQLRAALFLDRPSWEVQLPEVKHRRADAGHAKGVSYAKCLANSLPQAALVSCRLRGPAKNGSAGLAMPGRLASFRNAELRHDFAICNLGAAGRLLRHRCGRRGCRRPRRIHVDVELSMPAKVRRYRNFTMHVARDVEGAAATVPLELCRVDRKLVKLSFCSQPLFGYGQLRRALPWVIEDWLDYHLGHLGLEHAEIYDTDGSFAEVMESWARNNAWHGRTLTYHRSWPSALSETLQELSQSHPYCAETYAYAHCVTTHAATSRWVALLHAPDEYLVVRKNPADWAFRQVVQGVESSLPEGETTAYLGVNAFSFARGNDEEDDPLQRGHILSASRHRSPEHYHHTPILDPLICVCAGPHLCYAETSWLGQYGGHSSEVHPGLLMVHHYVEMLPQHRGRCGSHQGPCEVQDSVMAWAVDMLRRL